ncbi:ROK family transcriptional regulator [Neobacillus sp. MM2021_6]|uniref:ROK family transcriptional regulator n=1 Tax=Bacillaceae TaxID=186817 RepID=UPI00140E5081|nr:MULTISPECIES: ROK family transcriptional regulator [Bacillaceae]MBO0961618.1 ROK family transcriptional regulator [Neobacillus sp. MM2021_6]NHC19467.1 ROK family transcriptional regulator [Bacillus sp. MM2020_4]
MVTGDAAYIKKINRSLIIREIVKEGMISRADLSKVTALTRATISAQVADLLDEGLIVETQLEHNHVGRKPIMLSLNGQAGYALGIDLDYGQLSFTLSNLLGQPISSTTIGIDTTDYYKILHLLLEQIQKYRSECIDSRYGIVGIVIAIHGLVSTDELVHYVPKFNWHDVHLKNDLENVLGINIYLENNANLSAFAERVFVHHGTNNLLCATLYSGIGLGMMMNSEFFRGHDGYAGEAGHMIIMPGGKPCNCGNKGCWEKYASESSIFDYLSEKRGIKNLTYEQIQQWLDEGDEEVHELLEQFIYYLSIGLNNMINMYNPDVLVLDSELLQMVPNSLEKIRNNLHSSISHYRELLISTIGKKSCGLGACALAIKQFLEVPMLNFTYNDQREKNESGNK